MVEINIFYLYLYLDCDVCKCSKENKCIIGNYERVQENQFCLEENCSTETIWMLSSNLDDSFTAIDQKDNMSSDKEIDPGNIRRNSSQILWGLNYTQL